jgi:ribose transport system permease protein
MFVVMSIIVRMNGVMYYGTTWNMWRSILVNTSTTSVAALAIWLQLKNGRFDFSGGVIMLLSAIIAGNIAIKYSTGPWIYLLLCVLCGVVLCLITSLVYVFGRLPIIICSIGVALVYESITYLIFDARGVSMMSNTKLTIFGRMPYILVVLAVAAIVFIGFSNFTVAGKQAKVLQNNQQAGVNIGIKERKNVILTFLCCGLLLGLAAAIYGSQNNIAPQSALSTAGTLFQYIIPAYMGFVIGMAGNDAIGVIMAALGMELLNYGLACLGMGAGGYQQLITGSFMLLFYGLTAQLPTISSYMQQRRFEKKNKAMQ